MFDFKETSENFGDAFEDAVRGVMDEYRPQIKADIDVAIEKVGCTLRTVADASIQRLAEELNGQMRCAKGGLDDSIRLIRTEMSGVMNEALISFRRTVVIPTLLFYLLAGMALAGVIGFWVGRVW